MFINIGKVWSSIRLIIKTFRHYKRRFLVMIFLGSLGGLFGSLGIGTAIPLFSVVTGQSNPSDFITDSVKMVFEMLHLPFKVPILLLFLILVFTAKAVMIFIAKYYNDVTTATYEEETRRSLLAATLHARWSNLASHKVGYVDRVILYDVQQNADALNQISTSIFTLTSLAAYVFVALRISATITLATLGFGVILFFVFKPVYYRTRKLAERIGLTFKQAGHRINESIIGAKTIKIFGAEHAMIRLGSEHFTNLKLIKIRTALYSYLISLSAEPVAITFIATLFLISYREPSFNIIIFGVTVYIVQKIFAFIQSLQNQLQNINQSIPYLRVVNTYAESVHAQHENKKGEKNIKLNSQIEFNDVGFRYDGDRDETILSGVSFRIPKGSMTAIIGPSGSGKTTIVDLLLRLFEPAHGTITIDGLDIQDTNLATWRSHIAYVPQDTFLINDSIRNNVRFYDPAITEEDIVQAIRQANLNEFIGELPSGLDTLVGERGVNLSGGQRQRIALARALARKPDILILDEATSNLDAASESAIQSAINDLKGTITILIITHRVASVTNTDQVIVLERGKLIEQGKPEELAAAPGSYFTRMISEKLDY